MTSEKLSEASQVAGTSKKCKTCGCPSEYEYHEACGKKARVRIEILTTRSGDWSATYNADTGECLHQGHSPSLLEILSAIGVDIIETTDADHFIEGGFFPDKLPQ